MLRYIVIADETYPTNTVEECEVAEKALAMAGEASTPVWEVPFDSIQDAEDAGWDGARKTSTVIVAR